jgi:hypothetical protein
LSAFQKHVRQGWIPVAVVFGEESAECSFLPVHAGITLTGADLKAVSAEGKAQIRALLGGPDPS